MKNLVVFGFLFLSNLAFADTAQVVCSAKSINVTEAMASLNGSLKSMTIKSVSAPVISVEGYNADNLSKIRMCLSVTQ